MPVFVEPAVGPPFQAIRDGMSRLFNVETVEHDLRLAVGYVVAVFIRQKEELRWAEQPSAAHADLDAGQPFGLVVEHRALVVSAVTVGIFKDDNPVFVLDVEVARISAGPGIVLSHPQAAAVVGGDRNWVLNVGLCGEGRKLEAFWQARRFADFFGQHRTPG
jgi:hypothetical protein